MSGRIARRKDQNKVTNTKKQQIVQRVSFQDPRLEAIFPRLVFARYFSLMELARVSRVCRKWKIWAELGITREITSHTSRNLKTALVQTNSKGLSEYFRHTGYCSAHSCFTNSEEGKQRCKEVRWGLDRCSVCFRTSCSGTYTENSFRCFYCFGSEICSQCGIKQKKENVRLCLDCNVYTCVEHSHGENFKCEGGGLNGREGCCKYACGKKMLEGSKLPPKCSFCQANDVYCEFPGCIDEFVWVKYRDFPCRDCLGKHSFCSEHWGMCPVVPKCKKCGLTECPTCQEAVCSKDACMMYSLPSGKKMCGDCMVTTNSIVKKRKTDE